MLGGERLITATTKTTTTRDHHHHPPPRVVQQHTSCALGLCLLLVVVSSRLKVRSALALLNSVSFDFLNLEFRRPWLPFISCNSNRASTARCRWWAAKKTNNNNSKNKNIKNIDPQEKRRVSVNESKQHFASAAAAAH